jgi:hypothetical protein
VDAEDPRAPIDDTPTCERPGEPFSLDGEQFHYHCSVCGSELARAVSHTCGGYERNPTSRIFMRGLLERSRRSHQAAVDELTRLIDDLKGTRNA